MLRTPQFSGKPFILKDFFLLSTVVRVALGLLGREILKSFVPREKTLLKKLLFYMQKRNDILIKNIFPPWMPLIYEYMVLYLYIYIYF